MKRERVFVALGLVTLFLLVVWAVLEPESFYECFDEYFESLGIELSWEGLLKLFRDFLSWF